MTIQIGNFVWQLSSSSGDGNLTLVSNDAYVHFSSAFGTGIGNKFYYGIKNRSLTEWEIGIGYMLDATTLVRETIIESSNSDLVVNFSSGVKDVVCDTPAEFHQLLGNLGTMSSEDADDYYTKPESDSLVALSALPGSTYSTIQHLMNFSLSSGISSGGNISISASPNAVDVASGTGFIKAIDSDVSTLSFFDFPAASSVSVPMNTTRYIGVHYNAGSPEVIAKSSDIWDLDTEFPLGIAVNEGGDIFIINIPWVTSDNMANVVERFDALIPIMRDRRVGGIALSNTGTRNAATTSGALVARMSEFNIPAIDTSASDTFDAYYRDGSGGFIKQSALSQWDNTKYDDGSGTLADLTSDYYTSLWFYIMTDGTLAMVYGRNEYETLAEAVTDSFPTSTPNRIFLGGFLIGRLIVQKDNDTPAITQGTIDVAFAAASVTNINDLAGTLSPAHGGTGITNDPLSTITIGGAYSLQLTLSGPTNVTLPTSGTLSVEGHTHTASDITDFDSAAKSATVQDSISDGIVDVAPSQNAVFDALAGKSNVGHTHVSSDITDFDSAADARISLQKGAANGIATLGADSKIPTAQLPALAITSVFVVADETEQLALVAEEGDVAVRSDENQSYVHNGGTSGTIADWTLLLTPTDSVLSVNGQTGVVTLTTTHISEGTNLYYTQARFDSAFSAKSTTDLSEGTNLYYTDGRFDVRFATKTTNDLPDSLDKRYVTDADLVTLSNTSGVNTGDQTNITGNAGTATALQTARTIDGVSFDGTANITVIAPATNAAASKATPVDADAIPLADSAASFTLKKLSWANIKATLKTYFDTFYQLIIPKYTSAPQTITPAGSLTLAHGLGQVPTFWTAILVNVTPELGYAAGELANPALTQSTSSNNQGVNMNPDSTNLNIRFGAGLGSGTPVFSVLNKTTGASSNITNANWNVIFRAWAL